VTSSLEAATRLDVWEARFRCAIESASQRKSTGAGALLPIVPSQLEWERFLGDLRSAWSDWQRVVRDCPSCLLVLYGGLAFYEYDDKTFWPHLARAVGLSQIPSTSRQTELNTAFRAVAQKCGMHIAPRANGFDSVGSAVYQIGIPISMWDGFLEICEWAVWHPDWSNLDADHWNEVVEKQCGNRARLRRFLSDNRDAASGIVDEMLQLRSLLTSDPSLTLSIWQASFLREEYLEEVPETADFLRPKNPESLFRDRAQLCWDDRQRNIKLMLPAVPAAKLPATWSILGHSQMAATTPDEICLPTGAFVSRTVLSLQTPSATEKKAMRGLGNWSLFDLEADGRVVNHNREELPMRSYALVSRIPVSFNRIEGFSQDVGWLNEEVQLAPEELCYVTRLWPTGEFARIEIRIGEEVTALRFRARARIEARFFAGRGFRAAFSMRTADGTTRTDSLPSICVAVPRDYFRDAAAEVKSRFRVCVGSLTAGGDWRLADHQTWTDRQVFTWHWSRAPFIEKRASGSLRTMSELKGAFKRVDMRGTRTFRLEARDIAAQLQVDLIDHYPEIEECWRLLPGRLLPWFVLSQSEHGLTWEEMVLARSVIAPNEPLSPYLLRKCEKFGLLEQRGSRWRIRQSRASVGLAVKGQAELAYCGDPSIIWRLYHDLRRDYGIRSLVKIGVVNEQGSIPYMTMRWPVHMRSTIRSLLIEYGAIIQAELWSH
jgi:hypothetical protein